MPETTHSPQTSHKPLASNKPESHASSSAVLEDNREQSSQGKGAFGLDLFGSKFAYDGKQFKTEQHEPVKAKGDGFNTTVTDVAKRYKDSFIEKTFKQDKTNYALQTAGKIAYVVSNVGLQLPQGEITVGFDLGIKSLAVESDNGNTIKAKAVMGAAGEGAAKASVAYGLDAVVAAVKIKGAIKGSADFSLGDVATELELNLTQSDNLLGRTVEGYSFDLDLQPNIELNLEGSLSLRSTYLFNQLAQDWVVLYVKGLYFGASGGIHANVASEAGGLAPKFALGLDAWKFETKKALKQVPDEIQLLPSDVDTSYENAKTLFAREKDIFDDSEEQAPDKNAQTSKHQPKPQDAAALANKPKANAKQYKMGMAGLQQLESGADEEVVKADEKHRKGKQSNYEWLMGYIKKATTQTVLTTLKDQLENNDGLLRTYSNLITDAMKDRQIRLGKYLMLTVKTLSLDPEKGLTFAVQQSVDLFGSWLKSEGTIEMQYDLFHKHAYHYQYDLQGQDLAPQLAPLWRVQSSGIAMSAGNQKLILKGLDLKEEELLVDRAQLALKLPDALGGHAFLLDAKGLNIGNGISWQVLGGQTTSPINVFGQKSLVIEKLVVGSGDHQDGSKGIVFAAANLTIDLFKTQIHPNLHFAWDLDKKQFVGTLTGFDTDSIKFNELFFSNRGMQIDSLTLSLKKVIEQMPPSVAETLNDLEINVEAFKITNSGITIKEAAVKVPLLEAGALTVTNGELRVYMDKGKATGFYVAGKAALDIWGLKAEAGGELAYDKGEIDLNRTKFNGSLDLGLVDFAVDGFSFIKEQQGIAGVKLTKPSMAIKPGEIGKIKGIGKYVPDWLTDLLGSTELAFSADSYDSKTGFTKPRFIPIKLPIPLGGGKVAQFSYDKKSKTAAITIPALKKEWKGIGAKVEVPMLYGLAGLQVGGGVEFALGFKKESTIKGQYNDETAIPYIDLTGDVALFISAGARIQVGLYAGVPKLITISGGVYGKVTFDTSVDANAGAKFGLAKDAGWSMSADLKLASAVKGEAGAFIGYTIVGISGTKDFPLAQKELAQWAYNSHVSIGDGPVAASNKKVKLSADKDLYHYGAKSQEDIRKQLDTVAAKNKQLENDVAVKTAKADETKDLLEATKSKPENEVDRLMSHYEQLFSAQISQLKSVKNPTPQQQHRLVMLEQQREVWSKWHPGKLQIGLSRQERTDNNLKRRQKNLYNATMQLMHDKTVNIKAVRMKQLDDVAEVLDGLNEKLAQAKKLPSGDEANAQIAALKSRIANFDLMYEGFEKAANAPVAASYWQDIAGSHKDHIIAAVRQDPSILQDARQGLVVAQANYDQAVLAVKHIARQRRQVRERSGAESARTEQEMQIAEEIMNADHDMWYKKRKSFWRKLVGKSQDSIVGEAMQRLQHAEMELEFAEEKLKYTQSLTN